MEDAEEIMTFKKLIIATANRGKYREFKELAGGSLAEDIAFAPELQVHVEESGRSYAENAMLKARAWAAASGLPCLADDSGLEVHALDGAPGLYSARVVPGRDSDRVAWLLQQLEGVTDRSAMFAAALALCVPGEYTLITEGQCKGNIAHAPAGSNGFGYDSVFVPEGYELTFAQLPAETKNAISHRTDAFRKLLSKVK